MRHSFNLYKVYQTRQKELLSLAEAQSAIVKSLGMDAVQSEGTKQGEVVAGLIERLKSEKLRVLVMGRFSAGKSTFLNALFGEPVLPASPTPTTGVLCEVSHADDRDKKAVLFPKLGMGNNGEDGPFEVKISKLQEELGRYVKIDHFGDTQATSRFQKLELYWPLSLCKNGVTLVDSVGLDDPDSRDEITLQHAKSADAILYCMKSQDTYSAKDKQVLGLLKSLGYESIFFGITYYDHVKESALMGEMTEEEFQRLQFKNLAPWTELGEKGVKFVDSKSALLGRMKSQPDRVQASGIEDVEKSLESFLVQEKGRAKLLTTLRSLRSVNRCTRQILAGRLPMLQTSILELEKRYKEAEVPLKNLETKRQLMVGKVEAAITDIAREVYDLADGYFLELPDKIQSWACAYELTGSVGFPPRKKTLEPLVKEVLEHLKETLETDVANWNKQHLAPLIEGKVQAMQDSLESEAREFVQAVDQLRVQITLGEKVDFEAMAKQKEPSMLGRLISGGYTVLTGDFLTGGLGMFMGLKAMLTTILLQVVAGVILVVLGLLNPVAIVIAAISAILAGGFLNIVSLKNGLKKTVGEKLGAELDSRRKELAKEVEKKVREKLQELKAALDAGLASQLSSVKDEVKVMLEQRKQGKLDAEKEIERLKALEHKNAEIEEKLEALLCEAGI